MNRMEPYIHEVKYYETDRMGITHHSNYIRWMEEARVEYLRQMSLPYEELEEKGIGSPVTAVNVKYRAATTFPDRIQITAWIQEFNGVRLRFGYEMKKEDGTVCFEGTSEHCMVDREGKLIRLKQKHPEIYEKLMERSL